MDRDLKRELIQRCRPEIPVEPEDPRHFDFDAPEWNLRGQPWRERLAQVIDLSVEPTTQLVTGLRGSGKTTELHRLALSLRESGYRVVVADAGQWLSDERPIQTEDLMLALVLSVYPEGRPDQAAVWAREYAERVWSFLQSEVKLEASQAGLKAKLTTDDTLFQTIAGRLRARDGMRRAVHQLLEQAAEASRASGEELVILLDGTEKRATGSLFDRERRETFHNHWFGAFTQRSRDLKVPVHTVYTVPPFMVRRASELAAQFGTELQFLPMIRVFDRSGKLEFKGTEAVRLALLRRVDAELFADSNIPAYLAAHSGGYFRDLLRFVTEMLLLIGDAPAFTRAHAEAAVARIRQSYKQALAAEDKEVLAQVHRHPERAFPDEEAYQQRMDTLLQGFKMFRYHNGEPWYAAHPLCWGELEIEESLPSWEELEARP